MTFAEANEKIHPVETQWHYPILTKHGFMPETKEGRGLVRSYLYNHPDGRVIRCATGVNRDYFEMLQPDGTKSVGAWSDLESALDNK